MEQPITDQYRRGGGVGKILLDQEGVGLNIFPTLKGGFFFHASLANIFNKCHKKAVVMSEDNLNMAHIMGVYKIRARVGVGFLKLFLLAQGGMEFF